MTHGSSTLGLEDRALMVFVKGFVRSVRVCMRIYESRSMNHRDVVSVWCRVYTKCTLRRNGGWSLNTLWRVCYIAGVD